MTEEHECTSEGGYTWVSDLINETRNGNELVTDRVLDNLKLLLNGEFSDRELTQAKLKLVAKQLIEDMVPTSPEPEETE